MNTQEGSSALRWLVILLGMAGIAAQAGLDPELSLTGPPNKPVLDWKGLHWQLEEAKTIPGVWQIVPTATSPFTIPVKDDARFYRLSFSGTKRPPVLVRGYLAVRTGGQTLGGPQDPEVRDVYLPGLRVHLVDLIRNVDGESVFTDLSGRFTLPVFDEGRFRVCWEWDGVGAGCIEDIFSASSENVHLSTLRITLPQDRKHAIVFGKVRLQDGSIPRRLDPMEGVNVGAKVEVIDFAGRLVGESFVNNFGDYLAAGVPAFEPIRLRARVEAGVGEQVILPQANLGGAPFQPIDLRIVNSAPKLEPVVARAPNGLRIKTSLPGATVQLEARVSDSDGDAVRLQWTLPDGAGSLSGVTGSKVSWKLPETPGLYTVMVMASDGKGGYASELATVRCDEAGVLFSGFVLSAGDRPVEGAQFEVNGRRAVTDPAGFFEIRVRDNARFVINIRKAGYGLASHIYDNAISSGRWTLYRASVTSLNPGNPIDLVENRDERNCPAPMSERLNWNEYRELLTPQWQDGKGNVVAAFGKLPVRLPESQTQFRPCGPGARLVIPANALIDVNGIAPPGNVDIQLMSVDPTVPGQMPGDGTVQRPDGDTAVMQSYGAVLVEITAGTSRYNLKSGMEADVFIPVSRDQLAAGTPPPTIPILFYQEATGVWVEEGIAKLSGDFYAARVKHFSAINADNVKTDQSCVRILSPSLPANYDLEIVIPRGPGAAPDRRLVHINNAPPSRHVIYNLPSNTNIVLIPIRIANNIPMGVFVVNTGGKQNPTSPNAPAYPYDACSTQVIFTEQVVPTAPTSGQFLHGLYSFSANNLTELDLSNPALAGSIRKATTNYYQQIDPRSKRQTLAGFKSVNGFGGASEISVTYANGGDLGFGRNMHGVRNGADVATYVVNYGNRNTPDAQDVQDAINNNNPVATVAMEYSRIESPPGTPTEFDDAERVVKFYVYNNAGNLAYQANLDGFGERPVPQLCMVCHGGEYPGGSVFGTAAPFASREDTKLGSKFIPFDLTYYAFGSAPYDRATQEAKFKLFNQNLVLNSPPDATIAEVIAAMYAGGPVQDTNAIVAGWTAQPLQQQMYRDVFVKACRTCHASQSFPTLRFRQATDFINALGSAEGRVCTEHIMPHSRVTHDLFWLSRSPSMPSVLQIFGDNYGAGGAHGWNGTLCGLYTPGGSTPVSFYQTQVQRIWNGVGTGTAACTSCHTGTPATAPAGLVLTAALSYSQIVNVSASEVPALKRVLPGNYLNSYLWRKVDGTHAAVGGSGTRMPQGASPLGASDIDLLRNWINSGANP